MINYEELESEHEMEPKQYRMHKGYGRYVGYDRVNTHMTFLKRVESARNRYVKQGLLK